MHKQLWGLVAGGESILESADVGTTGFVNAVITIGNSSILGENANRGKSASHQPLA
ncbi:MAG: hypothetical protein AAFQ91_32255 [Cyanobacteria bacterium J06621_15]